VYVLNRTALFTNRRSSTPLTYRYSTIGSGHQSPGLWRHPDDQSWKFTDVEHWVELAKTLEEAKFHGIFIADVLGKRTPID